MKDLKYYEQLYGKGNTSLYLWLKNRGSSPTPPEPTLINTWGELSAKSVTWSYLNTNSITWGELQGGIEV